MLSLMLELRHRSLHVCACMSDVTAPYVSMNFTLGDSSHWVAVAQAPVTVVPYYSDGKDSEEIKLKLQVTHLLMENALRLSD